MFSTIPPAPELETANISLSRKILLTSPTFLYWTRNFSSQRSNLLASHLDPPANGQAVVYLTGLLEIFISESIILATVSDNSVRYQAILWSKDRKQT